MVFGWMGIAERGLRGGTWSLIDLGGLEEREDVFGRKSLPLVSHVYLHHYINIHQGLLESSGLCRYSPNATLCCRSISRPMIIVGSQHLAVLDKSSYSNASNCV